MEVGMKIFFSLIAVVVFSLVQTQALGSKKSYIVYLGAHSHGIEASAADHERATDSHYEFLSPFLGSKESARAAIIYSYSKHINAFAANLEEEEALEISRHPSVISVVENKLIKLHTTRSWDLVDLERDGKVPDSSIWAKARFGEDTIIATLDTGVWPESESFSDKGMGPVPSRWKGSCQNNTIEGVPCNRKLIGAKYFNKGYGAASGDSTPPSSARDTNGHGTHTLSTAGGRFVPGANFFGHAKGTAKGGSPDARVAVYKVCWGGGSCAFADILAGFDEAIHDGVDVISVSLGGSSADYSSDTVAVGSFHAVMNGITVVCSAGNGGPYPGSLSNTAPWIITVGASTLDREFVNFVTLGNKKQLKGKSLSEKGLSAHKLYPLINAKDAKTANSTVQMAQSCNSGSLEPKKVKGKIVVCIYELVDSMVMGQTVLNAGGAGMVVVNSVYFGNILSTIDHLLPATNIGYLDGVALSHYINTTKSPMASISVPATWLGVKPTPMMADFSSRGPSFLSPQILKPDVTAPGVMILASWSEAMSPTEDDFDPRRTPFNIISGTSMSCPHVSGVAGLLKTLHPDWSPAMIRSAIMTTARTRDNTGSRLRESSLQKSNPFAYGSGHVRPNRAMDPGLVYDLGTNDYLDFLCGLGYNSSIVSSISGKPYRCPSKPTKLEDLNYPSIAVPTLNGSIVVTRTLKNVGAPGTYRVHVEAPTGISVSVKPQVLSFDKAGEERVFKVGLRSEKSSVGVGYAFGMLIWSDGNHYVRSPLVVNALS